jgi:hypothetical protein
MMGGEEAVDIFLQIQSLVSDQLQVVILDLVDNLFLVVHVILLNITLFGGSCSVTLNKQLKVLDSRLAMLIGKLY